MAEHGSDRYKRKASLKLRPQIAYTIRWTPEVDGCTGESGAGLLRGLKIWSRVRRGMWRDEPFFGDCDASEVCWNQDHHLCMMPGCECHCHADAEPGPLGF